MADQDTLPESTEPTEKPEPKVKGPKKVFVQTKGGDLLHLFTNVMFGPEPKRHELDGFLQAQIDAGKLEVVQP